MRTCQQLDKYEGKYFECGQPAECVCRIGNFEKYYCYQHGMIALIAGGGVQWFAPDVEVENPLPFDEAAEED